MRVSAALFVMISLSSCASPPPSLPQPVTDKMSASAYVHAGDLITYTQPSGFDNSFCVTAVSGDTIRSTGPLTVEATMVKNLRVTPKACINERNVVKEAGQVVGSVLVTPFVLVCVAAGGCSMR